MIAAPLWEPRVTNAIPALCSELFARASERFTQSGLRGFRPSARLAPINANAVADRRAQRFLKSPYSRTPVAIITPPDLVNASLCYSERIAGIGRTAKSRPVFPKQHRAANTED